MQRVQSAEPALTDRPLALVTRDSRRGLIVAAANLMARAAGVRSKMRLAEATALATLETRQFQPDEDLEALCNLAEQAQQFSPVVGIEQIERRMWAGRTLHQPESLILDVTGLDRLFAGYDNLLEQVCAWLQSQRLFGCLALANNVGAAWALANFSLRTPAETHAVPRSRCITASDHSLQWRDRLPVAALRIDEATHTTLQRLGIRTIAQLAQLPRSGLANRLGQTLLDRLDQLSGNLNESIYCWNALPEWCMQQELEIPTDHRETITELVKRGMKSLADRLEQRGEGALRIVCRLDLVEHVPLVLQLGLYRPSCDPDHLILLINSLLEQQLPRGLQSPMWRMAIQATLVAPLVWRQGDLFDGSQADQRQQLASLVDTLSARLGRKQVLAAKSIRDTLPELAYELKPLTGLRPDGNTQDTARKIASRQAAVAAEPNRDDPLRRPTQLIVPAKPIEVAGVFHQASAMQAPDSNNPPLAAAPSRIKTVNGWHRVVAAVGPERLESGWWRGESSRRDYYRIITHQGCWWWIYRDLNAGRWFLHGIFD